jgi:ribosomal protein S21
LLVWENAIRGFKRKMKSFLTTLDSGMHRRRTRICNAGGAIKTCLCPTAIHTLTLAKDCEFSEQPQVTKEEQDQAFHQYHVSTTGFVESIIRTQE